MGSTTPAHGSSSPAIAETATWAPTLPPTPTPLSASAMAAPPLLRRDGADGSSATLQGAALAAAPPPPPPPLAQPAVAGMATWGSGTAVRTAQELICALELEGVRAGLASRWAEVEALQAAEAFTCGHIAWIFSQCSRVQSIDVSRAASARDGEVAVPPVSARLVQLFSNYVCERIPELTTGQITTFVEALTSQALRMDEFWLFMLAKKVQDTTASFTAEQIVLIGRRYAEKGLEDDEFFEALSLRVHTSLSEFSLSQLADFLLSCSKIRFLHEGLCASAFPLFHDPAAVAQLRVEALGAAVTAAAFLDQRRFRSAACCQKLVEARHTLGQAMQNMDLCMGLALASAYSERRAGLAMLLPQLLAHIDDRVLGHGKGIRSRRQQVAMTHRRMMLIGLCAAFGVPNATAWPLALVRSLRAVIKSLESALDTGLRTAACSRDVYEPLPSSFHLEVVAVLRLLSIEHTLEHPQRPFTLDVTISPAQLKGQA